MESNTDIVVNLKLATQPDVVDRNGRVYSKEVYEKALERINNQIDEGTCYVTLGPEPYENIKLGVSLSNILGKVIKKNPDSVDVKITNSYMKKLVEESLNLDEYSVGMSYMGKIEGMKDGAAVISEMHFRNYYLQKGYFMIENSNPFATKNC